MELKDIKALQDMGFTLDEIKSVYFTNDTQPAAAESSRTADRTSSDPEKESKESSENKKKDSSDLTSLKDEITQIKNLIYKQNASENKGGFKAPETSEDILKGLFNKEV